MKKYEVTLSQDVSTIATVFIEAESEEAAENTAWEKLRAGEYDEDFVYAEARLRCDCEQGVERVEEIK